MKHGKTVIVAVLLASLLLSSCAQPGLTSRENAPAAIEEPVKTVSPVADTGAVLLSAGLPEVRMDAGETAPIKPDETENVFAAKFEGDRVAAAAEVVDGKYQIKTTATDGEAWHIKLECNYHTVPGRDYRVTYHFNSSVAGTVKFGDFQEFPVQVGENTVTGVLCARDGLSYMDLQLGMLPAGTVEFSSIVVEELTDKAAYENLIPEGFRFDGAGTVYEQHDEGYDQQLKTSEGDVSLHLGAAPSDAEVWKSRLFVRTGITPENGARYRVSATLTANKDMDFEICYNNEDTEKGYAALYGQHLKAGESKTVEQTFAVPAEGTVPRELVLQFALGKAAAYSDITVSGIQVEAVKDEYRNLMPVGFSLDKTVSNGKMNTVSVPVNPVEVPLTSFSYSGTDTVFEGHDDGYVVELTETASSATLAITQAPETDRGVWKARLYAATGVALEAETSYRISFDLASTGDQATYEACFDGDYENAYGILYDRSLTAGGTDHVELIVTPDVSHGPLTIRLQMGKTDTTAGNTVTLSGLKLEKLAPQYQTVGKVALSTGGTGNVSEEHYDGIEQTLTASGSSAALNITAARSGSEGGVWSSKLLVKTGVVPEAGEKYRVSVHVSAAADTGEFEILYQNSGNGVLYGDRKRLSGAGDYSGDFTAPASGCGELVLVFQLGETAAPNTFTVSDIQVCKMGGGTETAVALSGFAYPISGVETATYNSFDLEASNGAAATLTGNGTSATATVTTPGEDWHVKLYAKPDLALEAGQRYTISMDVTGASGCTACYKNTATGAEDGFGTEALADGTVTHTVTPTANGTLEILLKIGNVPAGTAVTVSNIQIKKTTTDYIPVELSGFGYPVVTAGSTTPNGFDLEANNGAAATLTGDGTSATAIVTTPRDDWHVKLYAKPGLTLEAGKTYQISMKVNGAPGCTACYKNTATGEEEGFGKEAIVNGTVTHTVTPTAGGNMEILLKIGNVPAGTAVTVSDIQIKEITTTVTPIPLAAFGYPTVPGYFNRTGQISAEKIAWDGSAATVSPEGGGAKLTVTQARDPNQGGMWSTRLEVNTGVILEQGVQYKVSGTLSSAKVLDPFEVLYSNGNVEDVNFNNGGQGYSEGSWGLKVETAGGSASFEKIFTVPALSEYRPLVLRIQVGDGPAPNTITVSNIKVEKWVPGPVGVSDSTTALNSFALEANSGAAATLSGNGSSATATVTTSGDDWHIKFYAKPGVTLEAGKTYQISMNVSGASGFQVCYKANDNEEGFGTETAAGTVTHTVTPTADGTLEILLKIGNVPAGTSVTVSGIQIAECTTGETDITPAAFAYPFTIAENVTPNSFALDANSGAAAALSGNGSSATATVTTPGESGHVKLYAKPGVTLEAGKTYQISMDVTGADGCTASYKNIATGAEDGFGTETIGSGTVTHTVTATASGMMEILLQIGNLPANTAVTVSNIQIAEYKTDDVDVMPGSFTYPVMTPGGVDGKSFALEANNGAAAALSGDGSCAEATVTTSGDDWHIKLYAKPGVALEAGQTYQISMNVTGADGCTACYKNTDTGAEDGFGTETISSGVVTHAVTPTASGVMEILLKIGTVPAGSTVTVSDVSISKLDGETAGDNLMTAALTSADRGNVNFWAHESYTATLSGDGSSASLAISAAPDDSKEAWKVKLFAETGVALEAGKHYRISADVKASAETDYEICYNNGAEEKGVGALYGLHADAEGQTAVFEATPETAADLILQFNLGWAAAPCTVTVSNVTIEEMVDGVGESVLPSFSYDSVGSISSAADDGYIVSLNKGASSAAFRIEQAPEERNPWNVKLNVSTGFTPKKDQGYVVSFDLETAKPQGTFEVFYDGSSEAAYGQLTGQSLAAGKKTFSFTIYPGESKGALTLQLRLGKTDGTDGNSYTVSNVKVQSVSFNTRTTTGSDETASLWTHNAYSSTLERTPQGATVTISKTPAAAELEPWKTKLFIVPGVTLQAGVKYRISFDISAEKQTDFEVCLNRDGEEKGFGAMYGLTAYPETRTVEYTAYAARETYLILQISLGKVNAPNGISITNVRVEKAGATEPVSTSEYVFS